MDVCLIVLKIAFAVVLVLAGGYASNKACKYYAVALFLISNCITLVSTCEIVGSL